jgi:short-subunit dehydrogenase
VKRVLDGTVTVLTGATSGVGRATAHELARHGSHLVLAARSEHDLAAAAEECRAQGVTVETVVTDLSKPKEIDALARTAADRFGRIDTWINVAAVLVAGDLVDCPVDELDRLVKVNVRGVLLASRAALSVFDTQRAGVLINVSSILGVVPNPVVPAYTMSKFAIHGLTLALDHATARRPIRACVVLPGPIDTEMFQHAGNHTGHPLRSVPPAVAPERVAAAIVRCARRPRRRVVVSNTGRLIMLGVRVSPRLTRWAVAAYSGRLITMRAPAPESPGTVFEPSGHGSVSGGWRRGGALRRSGGRAVARAVGGRAHRAHRAA